jgi:hypothetical protein
MCTKDIPSPVTGSQGVSDDSYTGFGVTEHYDLKGDFWVIHANSLLHNYSNNLYQEFRLRIIGRVIA